MLFLEQYMVLDVFVSKLADKLELNKTITHLFNFSSQHTTFHSQ